MESQLLRDRGGRSKLRDPSPVGQARPPGVSDLRHYARMSAITGEWSATHPHVYIMCVCG